MLKFLVLLVPVACAVGAAVPVAWLRPSGDGRIVGGETTDISSHPYIVSIQFLYSHTCGGCILSEKWIASAAHCADINFIFFFTVLAGSTDLNKGGVRHFVRTIKIHENYNQTTHANDISLFELATRLKFGLNIKPIPIAAVNPKQGDKALVVGYGATVFGETNSSLELRAVDLRIVDKDTCNIAYGIEELLILDGMICAYEEDKDSCQGDSGGPLVCDGELAGIVSWGLECAKPGFPGAYTAVAYYNTWIKSHTESK